MTKMINIVEDLHKGIDLNELARMPENMQAKKQADKAKEDKANDEHQGHGE